MKFKEKLYENRKIELSLSDLSRSFFEMCSHFPIIKLFSSLSSFVYLISKETIFFSRLKAENEKKKIKTIIWVTLVKIYL